MKFDNIPTWNNTYKSQIENIGFKSNPISLKCDSDFLKEQLIVFCTFSSVLISFYFKMDHSHY